MLAWHHDGGGEVVAEEQLVLAAQQVVLAVPPGGLGVGAGPAPGWRGPGEGLQVRPVHRQRGAGAGEPARDGRFQQVRADAGEIAGRQPVWLVFGERVRHECEGVPGLPAGQQVRAVLPVREHPRPDLVVCGQAGQRLVHAGQVGGPVISLG